MDDYLEQRAFGKLQQALALLTELHSADFAMALISKQEDADEQIAHMKRKVRRYKARMRELATTVARYERMVKRTPSEIEAAKGASGEEEEAESYSPSDGDEQLQSAFADDYQKGVRVERILKRSKKIK